MDAVSGEALETLVAGAPSRDSDSVEGPVRVADAAEPSGGLGLAGAGASSESSSQLESGAAGPAPQRRPRRRRLPGRGGGGGRCCCSRRLRRPRGREPPQRHMSEAVDWILAQIRTITWRDSDHVTRTRGHVTRTSTWRATWRRRSAVVESRSRLSCGRPRKVGSRAPPRTGRRAPRRPLHGRASHRPCVPVDSEWPRSGRPRCRRGSAQAGPFAAQGRLGSTGLGLKAKTRPRFYRRSRRGRRRR